MKQENTNSEGIIIKQGRRRNQFMITDFDVIDFIIETGSIELMGFYTGLKRYINRATNDKENQITFKQSTLAKSMNVSNRKYYNNLKNLYNCGLLDIEKVVRVKYFVNYNKEGIKNPFIESTYVMFSSIDKIDIELKGKLKKHIAEQEGYPEVSITITSSVINTYYIIHEVPAIKTSIEDIEYRVYDEDLIRFRRKANKVVEIVPSHNEKTGITQSEKQVSSQIEKEGTFHNEKMGASHNEKTINSIIKLINKITKDINSIKSIYPLIDQEAVKSFQDRLMEYCDYKLTGIIIASELLNYKDKTLEMMLDTIVNLYYRDSIMLVKGRLNKLGIRQLLEQATIDILDVSKKRFNQKIVESKIKNKREYFAVLLLNELNDSCFIEQFVDQAIDSSSNSHITYV